MTYKTFGRYEIKGELGRGGMAIVLHAYDPRFKRDVALKILPREFLFEQTFRERFEREAQAIAALEHSAIVPVYDFGEEEGQPYFVMRFMPGGSATDCIREAPLPLDTTVTIINRVAAALDFAHVHGIVHRDVKPANILFDKAGEAYLSDFGIVRLAESTSQLTGSGIVGTPAYIAPEMTHPGNVTPLVDIYALGVTLFEMLTGRLPYNADTPMGMIMAHVNEPIPRLRDMQSGLPKGLQQIIDRAMDKTPSNRYPSAGELATDLQNVLRGIPVGSGIVPAAMHPASASTPGKTPGRTHSKRLWVGGLVAGCVVIAGIAVVAMAITGGIGLPPLAPGTEETMLAEEPLSPPTGGEQTAALSIGAPVPTMLPAMSDALINADNVFDIIPLYTLEGHTSHIADVAWSPDGSVIASGSWDETVMLWDAATGERLETLPFNDRVFSVSWSPDGTMLAIGLEQGTVILWNVEAGEQARSLNGFSLTLYDAVWSPDGATIAVVSDNVGVIVVDATAGEEHFRLTNHLDRVFDVDWSPDGTMLVSAANDQMAIVWDAATGERLRTLAGHTDGISSVEWSQDGAQIATGSWDSSVIVWDAVTGEPLRTLLGHNEGVQSVAWSPDGRTIAAGSTWYLGLWDVATGNQLRELAGHTSFVEGIAWSPDGLMVAGTSNDIVVVWGFE